MEHIEIGEVVKVSSHTVEIQVKPPEDCGNCGAKSSCHAVPGISKDRFVTALDPFGLQIGQRVKINLQPKNLIKASIIIFVFPLIGLLLGAIAGSYFAQIKGYTGDLNIYSVIGGFIGLGITILGLRSYNKRLEKANQYYPTVVEIV